MSILDKDYLHDLFIEEASAIRVKHRKVETAYQDGYDSGRADGVEEGVKSEYDRFWDAYQDYGNRTNYIGAFIGRGWTTETFKPKYDIVPTKMTSEGIGIFGDGFLAYGDLAGVLEQCGVTVDTSNVTTFDRMAKYESPRYFPAFDLRGADDVGSMFYNASVHTVDKLIFRDSGDQTVKNMFFMCYGVRTLGIEGVIGKTINLQWSDELEVETMKSIITHLKDHSDSDQIYVNSVLFSEKCWTRLEANSTAPSGGTWRDYVDSLGWLT